MFQFIRNGWKRFTDSINSLGAGSTLSKVIEESDVTDRKEIEQANAVIVNHQYLKHMAEARITARAEWRRLQALTSNQTANVTPLLVAEHARAHKT